MNIGYARVSTREQNLDLQKDALEKAGCIEIFEEKVSGAGKERPQLTKLIEQLGSSGTNRGFVSHNNGR